MKNRQKLVMHTGLLLLAMQTPSYAGVTPHYQHYVPPTPKSSLWQTVLTYFQPQSHEQRDYHWIETSAVTPSVERATERPRIVNATAAVIQQAQQQQKPVVAPSGMFRTMNSLSVPPVALNGGNVFPGNDGKALLPDRNLVLSVSVPFSLPIADSDILWQLRALANNNVTELRGRTLGLTLPDGRYEVTVHLGNYQYTRTVDVVYGRVVTENFPAEVGLLRASSEMNADWQVFTVNNGRTVQPIAGSGAAHQINAIVPAGEYEVVATVNNVSQRQRLHVGRGQISLAAITIPTGKVNLVATLGNAPAMRPMQWRLYRLEGNGGRQEIAAPVRHSATLEVAPGHYEAVANLDGRVRSREFTVLNGTSNNVILAMD